jgi:signal transduction histidine kinase
MLNYPTCKWYLTISLVISQFVPCFGVEAEEVSQDLETVSLSRLEKKLVEINTELKQLAHYSLRSGIGVIGYRSEGGNSRSNKEWVEVDLGKEIPIDEVVLVPTIWRDTEKGFQPDGFPEGFKIFAGTDSTREGSIIAEYKYTDDHLPHIAPLVVPVERTTASWVRIETTRLTRRAINNDYVFQLSELLVFSGEENVALQQPIKTSSSGGDNAGAWSERFLVDGFMPYLMDSAQGSQSVAYVSTSGSVPTLIMDLEEEQVISRIHLHSVDQSDTVPQAWAGDLGIPERLKIEGASKPDFSDAVLLLDYHRENINDIGPIMMYRIPETTCRYVRFVPRISSNLTDAELAIMRIGFAEIELFSKDRNVALGKVFTAIPEFPVSGRSLSALTDGKNLFGKILPTREWIQELARRHELETERPRVISEINRHYGNQKATLTYMSWLVGILAAGIAITILVDRNIRLKQVTRMKEQFAADLHDELGANLHTIGLLTDLAKESVDSKDELLELLDQTRDFSERSGIAARYCTNMLEAKGLCEDLVDEMNRTSRRLLSDLQHDITFEGEEILHALKPRRRIDLYLFYKESLTNIIRHSEATKVITKVVADNSSIHLSIEDNGHGLENKTDGYIPPSLKRRTNLLRGQIAIESAASGGLRVILQLKFRKFIFIK